MILPNQISIPLPIARASALSSVVSSPTPVGRSSALITPKIYRPVGFQLLLRLQPSSFTPSLNPRSARTKLETAKQSP